MPLSISKLKNLLLLKNLVPINYFIIDDLCVYIHLKCVTDSEEIFMYIPTKYKIKLARGKNIYEISYIDLDENDNSPNDFVGELDEYEIENTYSNMDIHIDSLGQQDSNFTTQLESNYKRTIKLKNISELNLNEIKNNNRQLKRLKFSVQDLDYKLCIIYKNFFSCIQRDGSSIETYRIKKFMGKNLKQLVITTDLESFYNNMESLMLNILSLKKGIKFILDKNHFSHTCILKKLLQEKNDIVELSNRAYSSKSNYEILLNESLFILKNIVEGKNKLQKELFYIKKKFSMGNLNDDVTYSHQLSRLNSQIKELESIKKDLDKIIYEIKCKSEDILLSVDKIMFDNTIMIDMVLKNFDKLSKIT